MTPLQSLADSPKKHGWCHYLLPDNTFIPFYQSRGMLLSNGTTGLSSWPAAWFLSEYARQNITKFGVSSILEIGAGIGLGGIFVAGLTGNKQKIHLTDVHNDVLRICEINSDAANEALGSNILTSELDWCSFDPEDLAKIIKEVDIVIGADIFYEPCIFDALCALLETILELKPSIEIILSATMRNSDTWLEFISMASSKELQIRTVLESDQISESYFTFDKSVPIHIVKVEKV
jgi:predicted nicotinamide N-methyase